MNEPPTLQVQTVETPWGWIAAAGSARVLKYMVIGHPHEAAAIRAVSARTLEPQQIEVASWHPRLAKLLAKYAAGDVVDFSNIEIDEQHLTSFQRRVVALCRRIPLGETLSYGELAEQAGSPRAARAVGSVMANNRYPLVVPCHRVVGSSGKLGGFSAPQGLDLKRKLLQLEAEACALA